VYATSAGRTAADGTGRNGLFTTQLLKNLKTPGLEVKEIFNRTGADVSQASNRQQIPAIYSQFFGNAYLNGTSVQPSPAPNPTPQPAPVVQPVAPPEIPTRTYKIGDRGPAGGIIFYDKGNFSDGWRYMEAAPVDLKAQWDEKAENVVGTGTEIGSGKQNTEFIVAALNRKGVSGKAAQLCREYNLNGYADWFLPSKDELDLIYKNLKQKGLGNLYDYFYWSSSQLDNNYNRAWIQSFSSGSQDDGGKNYSVNVRAVRAF